MTKTRVSIFPPITAFLKRTMSLGEAINFGACGIDTDTTCRRIGGYRLPDFQRPLVWTEEQDILLIESIWDGMDIGSYAVVEDLTNPKNDGLLLDGQQRLNALFRYQNNEFPVRGYLWAELTDTDRREFKRSTFPRVTLRSPSEETMKTYYNRMNFSGVRHTMDQQA